MKKIINIQFISLLALIFLMGCAKDETRVVYLGGTAPKLTASVADVNMNYNDADKTGTVLEWTNPDYRFNSGVSSHTVTYALELDTAGANFASDNKKVISLNGDLSYSFKISALNDIMLNQLNLSLNQPHSLEARVVATLGDKSTELVSNKVTINGTPYAIPPKVVPPANGTLWITGDATPAGWANPLAAPYDSTQLFTKVSETLYEITIQLPGGGGYKLIQENGVWGSQYHMLDGGTWQGGDFEQKDSDPQFPGPPDAGNYKITVDFQKGKFFASKL